MTNAVIDVEVGSKCLAKHSNGFWSEATVKQQTGTTFEVEWTGYEGEVSSVGLSEISPIVPAEIPKDKVSIFQQAFLDKLGEETKTKLKMDKAGSTLYIAGNRKAVAHVNSELKSIFKSFGVSTMQIPSEQIGLIVGKDGSRKNEIQSENDVAIEIPRKHQDSSVVEVLLIGTDAARSKAQDVLTGLLSSAQRNITVPINDVKKIIGNQGSVVTDIQEQSGAKVTVNRITGVVGIRGDKKAMDIAEMMIKDACQGSLGRASRGPAPAKKTTEFAALSRVDTSGGYPLPKKDAAQKDAAPKAAPRVNPTAKPKAKPSSAQSRA